MENKKTLFLLDGHALVYRAHYAFIQRPLINSKGVNTSAISGFMRTLMDLIGSRNPTHLAVMFDPHGPTFRHHQFEAYKANRDAQPEDISIAIPRIIDLLDGMNIPVVIKDGYEADDVIGTIAKQAELEGFTTYMVTPDKDYAQLVSENIFLYKPARMGNDIEIWGIPEVLNRWGLERPMQVADILGLQGDSVDNIPGIPGIGEKTAIILIQKYGSVENLIDHVEELKGKQQENVRNFAEQGKLSKELATIHIEVPVAFDADAYKMGPFETERLLPLFEELEFKSLGNSILNSRYADKSTIVSTEKESTKVDSKGISTKENAVVSKPSGQASLFETAEVSSFSGSAISKTTVTGNKKTILDFPHDYKLVNELEELKDLVKILETSNSICFDAETNNIDATQADLVGLGFSIKKGEAWYVHFPSDRTKCLEWLSILKPVFENPSITKIGQNLKYDIIVLKFYGIEVLGPLEDTMVAHYVLEPELRHNMTYLSEVYLGYSPIEIETLIGPKGKNQSTMDKVDPEKIAEYCGEDADITLQLQQFLMPKLKEDGLLDLYKTLEGPLVSVLAALEFEGVNINKEFLNEYSIELQEAIDGKEQEIIELAGANFNVGSPKQVGEILFDKLKIPYKKSKTATGQYRTDEDMLSVLEEGYPIAKAILDHRGLSKLQNTYVKALPEMINPRTGRVHTNYNQTVAATGRLSSTNPNLQNIPIKTKIGKKVRQAFLPRDHDHILVSADYSQIELRLIAEISKDPALIEAFSSGHDIHLSTAAKVYGIELNAVTPEQRRNAKTVNFSIIYGAGAQNLSQQLNIKRAEAKELIEQYFKQFSGLKTYMDQTVEFARKNGYVTTLLGRRRYLRDIDSRSAVTRANAERMAINSPIQGTAADLIKLAMIHIQKAFMENKLKSRMIMQVHDELVFDVYKPELEMVIPMIRELMTNALPSLKVPLVVEIGQGNNWLEAH
jgi:DNA polymerase I